MSSISVNIGDRIVLSASAKTVETDTAIDPTTVKAWTRTPTGTVTIYTYGTDGALAKTSTGNYKLTFDVDVAGRWFCGFYSTGIGKAASDNVCVEVKSSPRG